MAQAVEAASHRAEPHSLIPGLGGRETYWRGASACADAWRSAVERSMPIRNQGRIVESNNPSV